MPTYAYRCDSCGVEFERFQKFSENPLTRCPECRGKVRRVPQATGIVFKGSGWYVTDSKSTSSTSAPASKKPAKASDSDSAAKAPATESKAAASDD